MKKTLSVILVCCLCLGVAGNAFAAGQKGIVFSDAVLETKIREALGKPEGPITQEDADSLGWLDACADPNAPDSARIKDISDLRYFVNLTGARLDNNAIHDVAALAALPNLKELWVLGDPLDNLEPLGSLTGLVKLGFDSGFRELSFLRDLTNLEELRIDACRELPPELVRLQKLKVFCSLGGELADISLLARLPGLTAVDISWNLVEDLTPLANLPLTELYLQGNPIGDYTPIRELYSKLQGKNFDYIEIRQAENPDQVITFPDPVLEHKVRAAMEKPDGDITAGDAAQVIRLDLHNEWQPQIPREIQITNLQGIEAFISLRELDAGFNAISELSALSGLTELRKLNLGGNDVADASPLSALTHLEDLTLFGGRITDLSPLGGLTALRSLHIGSNPVSEISALAGLTRMENLYMNGCGIEDISPVSGMTELRGLEMPDNYVSDLTPLAGMTNLVMLRLANNPIGDYSPIEKIYPQLEEKDFEWGQVFDVEVPLKPEQPEEAVPISDAALEAVLREATGVKDRPLTRLDLSRIPKLGGEWQDVSDITALGYCINLEGVGIWGSNVSDLTPLSGLTRLRAITIHHSPLSDLTPLSGLTKLVHLELLDGQITDVSPLQSLTQLEWLDLSHNWIADFSPLYGLQKLSVLKISHNEGTDASGFRDIVKGLKEKDFEPDIPMEKAWNGEENQEQPGQPDSSDQPSQLLQPKNPDKKIKFADKVLERRIRETMGKPEGPITAGDAAAVTELYLNNEWQEEFPKGSQIAKLDGIEHFINLQRLDISWNKLKDLKKLSGLTELTYLRAYGNAVQDLKPLSGLVKLTSLNVGGNKVKSLKPLSGLVNLTELMLDGNPIKDFSPLADIYPKLQNKDFEMK